MEMFVLRSAMGFDTQKGMWKYRAQPQDGRVMEGKLDPTSMQNTLGMKMFTDHMDFVRSIHQLSNSCLLYTSPSPRDVHKSRMPSSA